VEFESKGPDVQIFPSWTLEQSCTGQRNVEMPQGMAEMVLIVPRLASGR